MAVADTAKLVVDLSLTGNFQSGLSKTQSSLNAFNTRLTKMQGGASRAASNIGKSFSRLGQNLKSVATGPFGFVGLTSGVVAVGLAFKNTVQAAGDFEASLHTINTIAGIKSKVALDQLGQGLLDVSKKTGIAIEDLTTGYYDLLSAGIKTKDAQAILNDAVTLGIGGLATTTETVDLLTTAVNVYSLDAKGAAKATDQFALAIQDGKVKADQISSTFANVAPLAKTYGIGIDQIAASYARLTAQGTDASEVTTEMQRAIISLISPNKALAKAQKDLKINFTEEIRKKGLVPALQELRVYADKNKIPLIDLVGRVEAVKYILQTTGKNFDPFITELKAMAKVSGLAEKQMSERQQGFNYQMARLGTNIHAAAIIIGSELLPVLGDLAAEATDWIGKNQDAIKNFAKDLGGAVRGLVGVVKGTIIPTLQGIAGAWNSIPAPFRDLLVKGLVADRTIKFLFGFSPVGALFSGITGALGKAVGVGLASAGLGKLFVQPVFVTNPGFGMPGGLPGGVGGRGLLGSLTPLIPIIVAAVIAALAAKGAADAANSDFANQGIKSNLIAPGAGPDNPLFAVLPFGIGASLQNIADTLSRVLGGGRTLPVKDDGTASAVEALRGTIAAGLPSGKGTNIFPRGKGKKRNESGADTQPTIEALRGKIGDHLAAQEIKAGLQDANVANSQDIESLRGSIATGLTTVAQTADITGLGGKIADDLSPVSKTTDINGLSSATSAATYGAASGIVGAINNKNLSINQAIDIKVNVSAAGVTKSVTIQNRYGPGNGSSGGDSGWSGQPGQRGD